MSLQSSPPLPGTAGTATSVIPASLFMVEDNLALRDLIRGLVDSLPGLRWSGGCGTLAEARQALAAPPYPDLLLLDLSLPDGDSLQVLSSPAVGSGASRVAFATGCQDENLLRHCDHPAVVGFIDKLTSRLVDWRRALQCLADGQSYFSAAHLARKQTRSATFAAAKKPVALTPRERQLLPLLAAATPDTVIASRLGLPVSAVRLSRGRLMSKLGVTRISDLAARSADGRG